MEEHFQAFLTTTVNLRPYKLELLGSRVGAIQRALEADETVGPLLKEAIPQGSWAQQTIIEPVGEHDEFDADVLVHLAENPDWNEAPREYLRLVRAALKDHPTYRGKVQKKNRCVRVIYANSCHVDVVPYVTRSDGSEVIVNFHDDAFEDVNPAGFAAWMTERDDLTDGNLRRVLRLLKFLRDYKNTFSCPSIILTLLVAGRVQAADEENYYSDIPTTLVNLLEDLDTWLALYPQMPDLEDPTCPGVTFNHRWQEDRYQNFKTMIGKYAGWARAAYDEPDVDVAVTKWQKLFGDEFVAREVLLERAQIRASRPRVHSQLVTRTRDRAPEEEFIAEQGYRLEPMYSARIETRVEELNGFRARLLPPNQSVGRNRSLKFKLITDARGNYSVIWKVRNRGEVAAARGQLRGRLIGRQYDRPGTWRESTLYPGRHFIEVYVVQDGAVVASDHREIVIT